MLEAIREDFASTSPWTGLWKPNPRVMEALRQVPRELFVPASDVRHAYLNAPLPIGHGQTISQPFIVALMTGLLKAGPEHRVLEVGTGSGYQAAILAALVREVYTVEVVADLAWKARERLARLGYANVEVRTGDGSLGWPERSPFDRIIVTAAAPRIPSALLEQLARPGRLVMPLGSSDAAQELMVVTADAAGRIHQHKILPVSFVPLLESEPT
jgi:protein-L-isoaspartate(D-aspartate) O-methyltransferase